MALILEDGTGLENADTYDTVANASAYAAAFGREEWVALGSAQKEIRMRLATQAVDMLFTYPSRPLSPIQALAFPRLALWVDGVPLSGVPKLVRRATNELATFPGAPSLLPNLVEAPQVLSESKQLDGLRIARTYSDRPSYRHFFAAEKILAPLTGALLARGMSTGRLIPC